MVEAPEPPHQHHHNTGLPWFDFIVPIAVLCISVASLLTSLQSEKSMHALVDQNTRLVEAQSTPLLMLDSANESENNEPVLSMTVSNVGTGPAQIAWFRLTDDGGQDYSGGALTERMLTVDPASAVSTQRVATLLRAGDNRSVFSWPKPTGKAGLAEWEKLNQLRFHLNASACYCSLFNECKITHFGETRPEPVPSCQSSKTD